MSGNLLGAGHQVRGYDPDPLRLAELEGKGGVATGSPAEAVQGCCRPSLPPHLGHLQGSLSRRAGHRRVRAPGLFVYDTTTGRPDDAVEFATALSEADVVYSDTTVSGNSELAAKADLVAMLGGQRRPTQGAGRLRRHREIASPRRTGGLGLAHEAIVNHALTVHRMVLAEALVVGELAGMDLDSALVV